MGLVEFIERFNFLLIVIYNSLEIIIVYLKDVNLKFLICEFCLLRYLFNVYLMYVKFEILCSFIVEMSNCSLIMYDICYM